MTSLRGFFIALAEWLDGQEHKADCRYGHTVQSGPLEGNKIPCTCGLSDLQQATSEVKDTL